ncbi:MAG: heavy-metal-associated domain-containing protein [Carboxydocellales bacterium]
MAAKVSTTFKLGGLYSTDNKRNVEDTLRDIDALDNVHVDLAASELTLNYDPDRVNEDYLKNTLNSLGYSIQGEGMNNPNS